MVAPALVKLTIENGRLGFTVPFRAGIGISIEVRDGKVYITITNPPPCWKLMVRYGVPNPDGTVTYGPWFEGGRGSGDTVVITPNGQSGSFQEFQIVETPCEETPTPVPIPTGDQTE